MDTAYGVDYIMILILVSGDNQRQRGMECIPGKTGIDMKVNGSNVLNMDKEQIFLRMGTFTQVNIKMGNLMAKDNIHGRMALFTLVILKMALNMARVDGKVVKALNVTSMKVIIARIKSTGMVCSLGQVGTFTRVSIRKTREMATAR